MAYRNQMKDIATYPMIVEHFNDEDGEYYVATSPNIKGLVTQGDSINELVTNVQDAIGGWIDGKEYPKVEDPTKWQLSQNQQVMWVTVDMNDWRKQSQKTVHRTVTVPEYLNNFAKKNKINVSKLVTQKLEELYN